MSKSFFRFTASSVLLFVALACASKPADQTIDRSEAPEGTGEYNYANLQTRSLDDMNAVVQRQIVKAKKFNSEDDPDSAIAALQAAAQYTLSRPDRDNLVSKVIAPIRTELKDLNALEPTMQKIVNTAIRGLNNKSMRASDRATYYFVLINYMAEFKPDLKISTATRKTYDTIEKAKIKMDQKVENDLTIRAMSGRAISPSQVASRVLKSVQTKSLKYETNQDDLENAP